MVEGQSRRTIFRPLNGNIAIVFPIHRRRRLVGRGYRARHRADDLAARGDILLARVVHAVKLIAARYRDIACHRAAVQVEAETLVVDADRFLGGVVQQLDIVRRSGVAVRRVRVDRGFQGGIGVPLRAVVDDRRDILHPCAVAAILAFAVDKGIVSHGILGFGVFAVGVFQLGGGDGDADVCNVLVCLRALVGVTTGTRRTRLDKPAGPLAGADVRAALRGVDAARRRQRTIDIDLRICECACSCFRRRIKDRYKFLVVDAVGSPLACLYVVVINIQRFTGHYIQLCVLRNVDLRPRQQCRVAVHRNAS